MKNFMAFQGSVQIYYDMPPFLSLTQDMLDELYDTSCCQILTTSNKKALMRQVGNLHYCVVSEGEENDSETPAALFRQLCLFHDLMCFRVKIVQNQNLLNRAFSRSDIEVQLTPLVNTMQRLLRTHQSMLVQSIEYVHLNSKNSKLCVQVLEDGINEHPYLLHAVLLCGTKLVAVYSKDKTWILLPRDILCLIIYSQSIFYTEEQNVGEDEKSNDVSINEDLFEHNSDVMTDASELTSDVFLDSQSPISREKSFSNKKIEPENNVSPPGSPKPSVNSRFDFLYFHSSNSSHVEQVRCGVYSEYNPETDLTLLLIYDPVNQSQVVRSEEEIEQDNNTIKRQLARTARTIDRDLNITVSSYLKVRAQIHVTMLHYLHHCPGMVHFIYVNRVRNTVIAPRIVSLHTENQQVNEDSMTFDVSTEFIKNKVWDMCYRAQQYRDEGYTEIGICGDGVQYWFKEWLEDETGAELRFCKNNLKFAKAHYELYTMYLPFVSNQAICHYNRVLIGVLNSDS
ncbi:HPS1 [Acrasis kona]|uniref:HPS1 n=1 Tax=Acrasis kona TaxID=1008807 RepID=A0AAW2ZDH2_9EUKA